MKRAMDKALAVVSGIVVAALLSGCAGLSGDAPLKRLGYSSKQIAEHRAERELLARRPHRLMFNNDGCDALHFPAAKEATIANFLDTRTTPLSGSQVDTVSYCTISSGFGNFTHNTKVGTVLDRDMDRPGRQNLTPKLIAQGTDTLQVVLDYCHKNDLECFWCMRMNDTHDGAHKPDKPYPLFPKLKADHPEYLNGTCDDRPKYGSWTSVNYALPEIRDLAFGYIEEVCRGYDVDGVELDFFRHMSYLKSVAWGEDASQKECDAITGLMRRIRTMSEMVGLERGRPILISVRVPDSPEYAKRTGLDIEAWLREGLVDIMIGSGYFRLNPWKDWVEFGKPYGIPMYAGLSESRVRNTDKRFRRQNSESYRARALRAWNAGVDGVYIFNIYKAASPFLREVGDPAGLATLDKLYFATVRDGKPGRYLADGNTFSNVPILTPSKPWDITSGTPRELTLTIGDDVAAAIADGKKPKITCHLQPHDLDDPAALNVSLNGTRLGPPKPVRKWVDLPVPPTLLKQGSNVFRIGLEPKKLPATKSDSWDMEYVCNHKLGGNKQPPWRRAFPKCDYEEQVADGVLTIADRDTGPDDWPHLMYPWHIEPADETIVEARLQVVRSSDPLGVVLRISNGESVEYVTFEADRVGLYFAGLSAPFDAVGALHTYRIRIKGADIQVFADGRSILDGTGRYREPAGKTENWLDFRYGLRPWNRRHLYMGSASGPGTSESRWAFIRFRSESSHALLKDFALTIDYPEP